MLSSHSFFNTRDHCSCEGDLPRRRGGRSATTLAYYLKGALWVVQSCAPWTIYREGASKRAANGPWANYREGASKATMPQLKREAKHESAEKPARGFSETS